MSEEKSPNIKYKYLPEILHKVRWFQHLAAIIAEALLLITFFVSAMDLGVGGVMANIPALKWSWSAIFALGVDVLFIISWVRVRMVGWSLHLLWSIPVAIAMSTIVFQPVVVQLLQSSTGANFTQALSMLGFSITAMVFARSLVAVILGAVLAMTNVESDLEAKQPENRPRRRIAVFDKWLDRIAPVVQETTMQEVPQQPLELPQPQIEEENQEESGMEQNEIKSDTNRSLSMPGQNGTSALVQKAILDNPDRSDREIAEQLSISRTTVWNNRQILKLLQNYQQQKGNQNANN